LIDRYPYGGRRDILRAMTIGDRDGVPAETLTRFATTGIAHVLAVSGLHVGSLCLALWILLAPFPVSRNRKYALILVCLVLYAGICGFRPPVTRSVIMAALAFGTILSERVKNIENSLFIALLIILAFDPQSLFGPSLELSFAAVWTLGMFYPPAAGALKERINLRGVSGYGIRALIISALATAGTAPVLAARFGSLPLYGIFANIPAVLLASIIVPLGMTSIFLTAAGNSIAPLAAVSAFLTGVLLRMLDGITVLVPNLPHASVTTGSISLLTGLGCAGWLYLLSRSHGRSGFKKGLVYIPLVLALVWTWNPIAGAGGSAEKSGTVVFFDVGQGDAALVGYGGKRFFLVDTGPRYGNSGPAETLILPSLKNLGITRLDGIFISHLHDDHTGGLTAILRDMKVDRIFCRASIRDSLALLYGDRVFGLSAGDSIAFHEGGMLVLSPGTNPRLFMNGGTSGENDRSLLLRCDIAETRVLFSGDIEEEVQKVMTAWGPSLSADILKVPHHGAAGLGGGFIHAVGPGLSVISCGANNRYGHPSPQTIQTLAGRNSRIWRTDRDGTMEIHLPGMATGNDESKYFKKIR
ncbi:DNA internalization-related competence protein ComEC/Rec2, partial [bacterium]|nr:DNA internalization-related competence protein ComEC/Rec2 [bacterium]